MSPNKIAAPAQVPTTEVPTSLYVLGAFIAVMLACIAGVLCFAICVRPLMSQMPAKEAFDERL